MLREDLLVNVTDDTFVETVLGSERPVVVDFWADWCPPCRMISATLADLAEEFGDRILVAKVNADENPLAVNAFHVRSLPTLVVFRGGEAVGSIIGARSKAYLREALGSYAEL